MEELSMASSSLTKQLKKIFLHYFVNWGRVYIPRIQIV